MQTWKLTFGIEAMLRSSYVLVNFPLLKSEVSDREMGAQGEGLGLECNGQNRTQSTFILKPAAHSHIGTEHRCHHTRTDRKSERVVWSIQRV